MYSEKNCRIISMKRTPFSLKYTMLKDFHSMNRSDKVARLGIRFVDLLNDDVFREKLQNNLDEKNAILSKIYNVEGFSFDEQIGQGCQARYKICRFIERRCIQRKIAE